VANKILEEMGEQQKGPTMIYCNNKFIVAMAKNPVHHNGHKNVATKYHSIREAQATKEIKLEYCKNEDLIVNVFTK